MHTSKHTRWRFDAKGACKGIPQLAEGPQLSAACGSRRACAAVHPCAERQGILWAWGDSGPDCWAESKARGGLVNARQLACLFSRFIHAG